MSQGQTINTHWEKEMVIIPIFADYFGKSFIQTSHCVGSPSFLLGIPYQAPLPSIRSNKQSHCVARPRTPPSGNRLDVETAPALLSSTAHERQCRPDPAQTKWYFYRSEVLEAKDLQMHMSKNKIISFAPFHSKEYFKILLSMKLVILSPQSFSDTGPVASWH